MLYSLFLGTSWINNCFLLSCPYSILDNCLNAHKVNDMIIVLFLKGSMLYLCSEPGGVIKEYIFSLKTPTPNQSFSLINGILISVLAYPSDHEYDGSTDCEVNRFKRRY